MPKQKKIHEGHKKTILHRVRKQISQSSNAAPGAEKKAASSTVATTLPDMISVAHWKYGHSSRTIWRCQHTGMAYNHIPLSKCQINYVVTPTAICIHASIPATRKKCTVSVDDCKWSKNSLSSRDGSKFGALLGWSLWAPTWLFFVDL